MEAETIEKLKDAGKYQRVRKKVTGIIKSTTSKVKWEIDEKVTATWIEELYRDNELEPWTVENCKNHKISGQPVTGFAVDMQNNYIQLINSEMRNTTARE